MPLGQYKMICRLLAVVKITLNVYYSFYEMKSIITCTCVYLADIKIHYHICD